jgi:transposase
LADRMFVFQPQLAHAEYQWPGEGLAGTWPDAKGGTMQRQTELFVGLDTSKTKISVALAEEGREGEVRFLGHIDNRPEVVRRLVSKLSNKHRKLLFCYEAGPTGYGLQRQIAELGHDCTIVAPSLIPKRAGEHVKTNRRDAVTLARLHRAGELTAIWIPDPEHEAIRDLVRAREAAMADLREKRQHLQSFLLRHGRVYPGLRPWTQVHARWLSSLIFAHPAQYLVLREYRQAIADAEARLERLTQQVTEQVPSWAMAPAVEAYQTMRGVAFITAVTFVAEVGDVRRFETPRQLMAYLGLVPSEHSTGEHVRRGAITKAGNPRARRVLIEGAWTYRYPARLSRSLQVRQESASSVVQAIAWKAQVRLCARYRRLMAAGKRQTLVTTAIAREMAAFLWAIGREVEPRPVA